VLPSIRRTGSYGAPPSSEKILSEVGALTSAVQANDLRYAAFTSAVQANDLRYAAAETMMMKFGDELTSVQKALAPQKINDAVVGALAKTHGVLEMARSGPSASHILAVGKKVTDATLPMIQEEGGALQVSNYLREMGVRDDLVRRVLPIFSVEVNRRKDLSMKSDPMWIAWSLGSWRRFYTEADRWLLSEVFHDPSISEHIEKLERLHPLRAATSKRAKRRTGPYLSQPGGDSANQ
jgi:hypothetical protein